VSDWTSDARLVRAFRPSSGAALDPDAWPATVPAAAQLLREGLELQPGITILVGENGSGKSTVVEMLAEAYGLNPQGGSILASGLPARVRETEPGAGDRLRVERGPGGRAAWAYFLRADTMHSLYTFLEQNPGRARRERLHELSHGQGFIEILRTRANQRGFYLMDEPDSPLSFVASLGLVALLHDLAHEDSQVIVATHSPIVAAVPGARVLELGDWGIRQAEWANLEIVHSWRDFLNDPTQQRRVGPRCPALSAFLSVLAPQNGSKRARKWSEPIGR
jgi:predicted ATPase